MNYITFPLNGVTIPNKYDTTLKGINLMLSNNIEVIALSKLVGPLLINTRQILNAMSEIRVDRTIIRAMRKEIQLIQSGISRKKKCLNR